jgi:hypothetical protein
MILLSSIKRSPIKQYSSVKDFGIEKEAREQGAGSRGDRTEKGFDPTLT